MTGPPRCTAPTTSVTSATPAAAQGSATVIRARGARAANVTRSSSARLPCCAPSAQATRSSSPLALVAAGCGSSDELPPAAGPDRSPPLEGPPAGGSCAARGRRAARGRGPRRSSIAGRKRAVLARRASGCSRSTTRPPVERLGRAPAGAGPTHVRRGRGRPRVRRRHGGRRAARVRDPRAAAHPPSLPAARARPTAPPPTCDNGRLWVTLTARNQLVELATSARPHRLNVLPDRAPARRGRRRARHRARVRARRGWSGSAPRSSPQQVDHRRAGEQRRAHQQPARRVAVELLAARGAVRALARAGDRPPEHDEHEQRQRGRDADVVDRVARHARAGRGRRPSRAASPRGRGRSRTRRARSRSAAPSGRRGSRAAPTRTAAAARGRRAGSTRLMRTRSARPTWCCARPAARGR